VRRALTHRYLRRSSPSARDRSEDKSQTNEEGPPTEAGRLDAFISYTRRNDVGFVDHLRDQLLARGKNVWVDRERIEPAADFRQRIARGIEAANAMIFVVSPESVVSTECRQELAIATQHQKLVVPVVRHDITDQKSIPAAIAAANWIFWREGDDATRALDQIVEALQNDIEWRDMHSRIAVRAREWAESEKDKSFLLRGSDLEQAERWYEDKRVHKQQPTDLQYEFIAASRAAASRRQKTSLAVVAFALVVAVTLASVALVQRNQAVSELHASESVQMAQSASALTSTDTPLSMLVSIEAYQRAQTQQAQSSLDDADEQPLQAIFRVGGVLGSVAYRPGGHQLAVVRNGNQVVLLDLPSGHTRKLNDPQAKSIYSIAYSHDGEFLAAGDSAGKVVVWNLVHRKRFIFSDYGPVQSVAFSSDGRYLASGDLDSSGHVVIRNAESDATVSEFNVGSPISNVCFSPNSQYLASGDNSGEEVRDVATHAIVDDFPDANRPNSAAYFSSGEALAISDSADYVAVWNLEDGSVLHEYVDGTVATAVAVSESGHLSSADLDGNVTQWSFASSFKSTTNFNNGSLVPGLAYSPDGRYLATTDVDGSVVIWNSFADDEREVVSDFAGLTSVAYQHGGSLFATGDDAGVIGIWRRASGAQVGCFYDPGVSTLDFSPNGKELVSGDTGVDNPGKNGDVDVWALDALPTADGECDSLPIASYTAYQGVNDVEFAPDGSQVAFGDHSDNVTVWDIASDKVAPFSLASTVSALTFSPGGKRLAAGEADGQVAVLRPSAPNSPPSIHSMGGLISTIDYSPNGKYLAAGNLQGYVSEWVTRTGHPIRWSDGSQINDLTFSHDSRFLATGDKDGNVVVWESGGGNRSASFSDGSAVQSVAFSPDDRQLASGDQYGDVVIFGSRPWAASVSSNERSICDEVRASMSGAQWSAHIPGEEYHATCDAFPRSL
jgi:WD40 repeat protein